MIDDYPVVLKIFPTNGKRDLHFWKCLFPFLWKKMALETKKVYGRTNFALFGRIWILLTHVTQLPVEFCSLTCRSFPMVFLYISYVLGWETFMVFSLERYKKNVRRVQAVNVEEIMKEWRSWFLRSSCQVLRMISLSIIFCKMSLTYLERE